MLRALPFLLLAILLAPASLAGTSSSTMTFSGRDDDCEPLRGSGPWRCYVEHAGSATVTCGAEQCTLVVSVQGRGEGREELLQDRLRVVTNGSPACTSHAASGVLACEATSSQTFPKESGCQARGSVTTTLAEGRLGLSDGDDTILRSTVGEAFLICIDEDGTPSFFIL